MAIDPSAVGRVYPSQSYQVSPEKVQEFADAIGDPNPIYVDAEVARKYGHDDIVAPPTFVMIPVMRGFDLLMADLGIEFARVVHVDQRFTYTRPLAVGDRLETTTTLDAVRQVAGNDLLAIRNDVLDVAGEHVCTAQATLLIRPEEAGNDA